MPSLGICLVREVGHILATIGADRVALHLAPSTAVAAQRRTAVLAKDAVFGDRSFAFRAFDHCAASSTRMQIAK
jgi:hypothetical protein